MGFLECETDLVDTRFNADHLRDAREFFVSALQQEDPKWLRKPVGPLKVYWEDSGSYAVCYLIELYRMLNFLQHRMTDKSKPIFIQKFKEILRSKTEKEFDAILTELQVASLITEWVSPISFEPLVPAEPIRQSSNKPKSPDYGLRFPDGDIVVEVTVFTANILEEWDKTVINFGNALNRSLKTLSANRIIDAVFPLGFHVNQSSQGEIRSIAEIMSLLSQGKWEMNFGSKKASLYWRELPVIVHSTHVSTVKDDSLTTGASVVARIIGGDTASVNHAFSFNYNLLAEDNTEILLKSFKNTIRNKRHQFPHEHPYILVIKLGHHRLRSDFFVRAFQERIWPNKAYEWMTGVCLFTPGRQYLKSDPPSNLMLVPNPNTRNAAPKSAYDMFASGKTFHLGQQ
jgi:hypothetical protein